MAVHGEDRSEALVLHSGHTCFLFCSCVGFIHSSPNVLGRLMKEHFDQRARPVPSLFHENLSRLSVELVCS